MLIPYNASYRTRCIELFDTNLGKYFAPNERQEFIDFLDNLADPHRYFVLVEQGQVRACGGYYVEEGVGALSWGMVHREAHGKGLGTRLTEYRLSQLRQRDDVTVVKIDTSQHTQGFYARQGFVVTRSTPDGFGAGIDCVSMDLVLNAPTA
ncbi:GNAT family N-acetyltransferase [Marinobacter hydrocarbonoclasticus]|nr:GNAT family N-acetyltransferase [Marinobacter nauticus]